MKDPNWTLINPEDAEIFPLLFEVSLDNYSDHAYLTYNTDAQSALDSVVDYKEEKELKPAGIKPEETSYFYSKEDVEQLEKEGYTFIVAGNYCRHLNAEHTQIHHADYTANVWSKLRVLEYNTGQAEPLGDED